MFATQLPTIFLALEAANLILILTCYWAFALPRASELGRLNVKARSQQELGTLRFLAILLWVSVLTLMLFLWGIALLASHATVLNLSSIQVLALPEGGILGGSKARHGAAIAAIGFGLLAKLLVGPACYVATAFYQAMSLGFLFAYIGFYYCFLIPLWFLFVLPKARLLLGAWLFF